MAGIRWRGDQPDGLRFWKAEVCGVSSDSSVKPNCSTRHASRSFRKFLADVLQAAVSNSSAELLAWS